jgi:hypothetical protein
MTDTATPLPPFGAPTLEQLTGLVFELASQLHIERAQRIALETALADAGVLAPDEPERAASQPNVRLRSAAALDRAMAGMMRVLTEDADPRTPLRAQTDKNP